MSDLTDYAQRVKGGSVPILGSLCWYSAAETVCVPHNEMQQHLKDVGLDAFAPKAPRDDDVFRRVCTKAQRKRVPTSDPKVFENYLVRDVQRKGLKVTKQIVQEKVDSNNKRLDYRPMIEVEFDTVNGSLSIDCLDKAGATMQNLAGAVPGEYIYAEQMAQQIKQQFQANRATLNGYAIRELFRRVLVSSAAIGVRSGVYFIGTDHGDRVDALEALAAKITDATFHSLPLVDDAKQRGMVRDAFRSETIDQLRSKLVEMDELSKLPHEELAKHLRRLTETLPAEIKPLKEKLKGYSELLEDSLDEVQLELKAFDAKRARLIMQSMGADPDEDDEGDE